MTYTIYSYIQPSGKRKVGCTSDLQTRVIDQQTAYPEILDETDCKVMASHLEAYWKGKFQLPLDELYCQDGHIEDQEEDPKILYVDHLDGYSYDWFFTTEYPTREAFWDANLRSVIFTMDGVEYELSKEEADKLAQTSRKPRNWSKWEPNTYFASKKVMELCKQSVVEETL